MILIEKLLKVEIVLLSIALGFMAVYYAIMIVGTLCGVLV